MAPYEELKLEPVRSEPDVWISRLVIYEEIDPRSPKVIRDVRLTRGLNIIWAEEPEDDSPVAETSGHSAGKTTFCRFLRYVLGETTFGTRAAMDLIRKAFPNGYVAAEIHVRGKKWAVRRPFGSGRMTYIKQDATIEEMLQERTGAVSQEDYPQKLGLEALLDDLETGQIVQTAENIRWAHILAWCTRDQETRFQNIYDWRSPRSESDTPAFRFPKAGPLFVMRAALGLFLPNELKGEKKLAELKREKERLEKEIEEKQREPQWRVNLYEHQLRQLLKTVLPEEQHLDSLPFRSGSLFPEDLERLTKQAEKEIETAIGELERQYNELQLQIDGLGAEIRRHENQLAELDTLYNLDAAVGVELDQGLTQHQEQRKRLEGFKDKTCLVGGVLIRDCTHVRERQRVLQITQLQDAHALEQAEAKREEDRRRIEEQKANLRGIIGKLKNKRQTLIARRGSLLANIRAKYDEAHELQRTRDELDTWMKRRDDLGGYEDLHHLRQQLDIVESEIAETEKELIELLRQHDENRERLAAIFSGAVRSVLSSDGYDGVVSLDNRELAFRITRGPAMSGEAVETLAVLLADVASLLYYSVSDKAHLPGFLVHDSPREADLGIRIYRSFIRFLASLQAHSGGPDKCPFQYVLTTTTPPPEELRKDLFVKIRLDASTPSQLLLRRNIAQPQNGTRLLWEEEPGV